MCHFGKDDRAAAAGWSGSVRIILFSAFGWEPTMTVANPIAIRVAHRHATRKGAVIFRGVPAARLSIEYTDSGTISAIEVARMLRPQLGMLLKLRFRRSLVVDPNGVEWEALDEYANVVSGRLILHAAVSESTVGSWAELTVDATR
jgi:hypothetical protein